MPQERSHSMPIWIGAVLPQERPGKADFQAANLPTKGTQRLGKQNIPRKLNGEGMVSPENRPVCLRGTPAWNINCVTRGAALVPGLNEPLHIKGLRGHGGGLFPNRRAHPQRYLRPAPH